MSRESQITKVDVFDVGASQVLWTLTSCTLLVVVCQSLVVLLGFFFAASPSVVETVSDSSGSGPPGDRFITQTTTTEPEQSHHAWWFSQWKRRFHVRQTVATFVEIFFLALATSTLIADAFFHLLPEAFEIRDEVPMNSLSPLLPSSDEHHTYHHTQHLVLGMWSLLGIVLVFGVEALAHANVSTTSAWLTKRLSDAPFDGTELGCSKPSSSSPSSSSLPPLDQAHRRVAPSVVTTSLRSFTPPFDASSTHVATSTTATESPCTLDLACSDASLSGAAAAPVMVPVSDVVPVALLRSPSTSSVVEDKGLYPPTRWKSACASAQTDAAHPQAPASALRSTTRICGHTVHPYTFVNGDDDDDDNDNDYHHHHPPPPCDFQENHHHHHHYHHESCSTTHHGFSSLVTSQVKRRGVAWANLFAACVHNIVDGAAIGVAFVSPSPWAGVATTISIFAHEVPSQIASVILLLRGGIPPFRAVVLNTLTGLGVHVGALMTLLGTCTVVRRLHVSLGVHRQSKAALQMLAVGNFLCLGLAMLLPHLQDALREHSSPLLHTTFSRRSKTCTALLGLTLGVALMAGLGLVEATP